MTKFFITHLFFCFIFIHSYSQDTLGIKFTQAKNWNEVKLEAQRSNKYIFVDAFTTWCAPCKMMTKDIFTKPDVGKFFNQNFINIAIQFDSTKNDNEQIKSWYKLVKDFNDKYRIDSYPTYLFFNKDGELVYKILGASANSDEFLDKSKNSLNPVKQYYVLKKMYEEGNRDSTLLLNILNSSTDEKDKKFISEVGNEYLKTKKNLLSLENIHIISFSTTQSTDIGFNVLINHSSLIDSVLGKGKSYQIVSDIIFNELVIPYLRNGGTKTDLGGGMIRYSGEINKNVNWFQLDSILDSKYPKISKKVLLSSKILYYDWLKKWGKFSEFVIQNISLYPELLDDNMIKYYMWRIINYCDNQLIIGNTLQWVKQTEAFENKSSSIILAGYAILLDKSGNKNDAILAIDEAIKTARKTNQTSSLNGIRDLKIKMEKGEKTW